MAIKIETHEDELEVFLSGEIDHHNSKRMREEIDKYAARIQPKTLILDFKGVDFMDSSGIGLVLGRYRMMQDMSGNIVLRNMPAHIKRVMRLAGIANLKISEEVKGESHEIHK